MTPDLRFRLNDKAKALAFSALATWIFFFPSLRNQSEAAGFMYTGDILGFYWPSVVKLHQLISGLHFNAIDINSFNGSSDFHVTPNFFGAHPFFVIYSLLTMASHPDGASVKHAMVVIMAIHAFLSCYFALRLSIRYFGLSFAAAAFVGVFFAFNANTVAALTEPEQFFAVTIMPWVAYGALEFRRNPSLLRLPLTTFPTVLLVLAGYMPVAIACLLMAVGLVAYVCLTDEREALLEQRLWSGVVAAVPVVCGLVVTAPYLLEVVRFMGVSPSAHTASLFFSAQQLAEQPQQVLHLLTLDLVVPGPAYEFFLTWGLVCVYIALLFLFSPDAARALSKAEWRTLVVGLATYAITGLAIYGVYSPVAAMVYYFVPELGGMHIYQRFLYPAGLAAGIGLALMFTAVLRTRATIAPRIGAGLCLFLMFAVAYYLAFYPVQAFQAGLNSSAVFDLILLALFACALITPFDGFRYASLIFLMVLTPMGSRMYPYSGKGNSLAEQAARQPLLLDSNAQTTVVNYFRSAHHKDLIKYVDLTPMWSPGGIETFPKMFPYLVMDKLSLSSYDGFNFYLSPPAAYMARMPMRDTLQMTPDWNYIRRTGADFVVAPAADLAALIQAGYVKSAEGALNLPNGTAIAPLLPQPGPPPVFDNGYFRVDGAGQTQVTGAKTNGASRFSVNVTSPAGALVIYELWNHPGLVFTVDGLKVQPLVQDGVTAIKLPSGRHRVQVAYRNYLQTVFWILLFGLLATCALSVGIQFNRAVRGLRRQPLMS